MNFHASVNAVILECANHLQAGAVANVSQAWIPVSAEVSLKNPAVLRAIEECAPSLKFAHAFRRFPGVQFRHAPVVEILTAPHRIGEMDAPVIAIVNIRKRCRNAAFGHDGMRFSQQRFANDPHCRAVRSGFNGGAQARSARSNHQNIVGEPLEFRHLQDSPVVPDSDRTQADVDVGKRDPKQARPRPLLVSRIQPANEVVYLVPHRVSGDAVKRPSDQVPERVTPEYITGEQDDIDYKNEASDSDSESVREDEPYDSVVNQKSPHDVRESQKIAVKILHDQRKGSFPQIRLA